MIAFTLCAKNYLAKALTARDSFLAHNPRSRFLIVVVDMVCNRTEAELLNRILPEDVLFFHELRNKVSCPRLEEMLVKYDVTELATAVKPFVFQYLLRCGHSRIVYLDPDMYVLHHFGILEQFLGQHEVALTPHAVSALSVEHDHLLLTAGAYNLGFIALKNGRTAEELTEWWGNRLETHCFTSPPPLFTDQKWLDLANCYFDGVGALKHLGYNVAWWNLHERTLSVVEDEWRVNEEWPLVCYHFSGYLGDGNISRHKPIPVQDRPDLVSLYQEYERALVEHHDHELHMLPYFYNYIPGSNVPVEGWRKRAKASLLTTADFQLWRPHKTFVQAYSGERPAEIFGVNLVGYLRHPNGVGQAARHLASGLLGSGVPFALTPLDEAKAVSSEDLGELDYYCSSDPIFDTSIYCVNADRIGEVARQHPHLSRKNNIGVFWWELEDCFPFEEGFNYVNHVVVFTEFVRQALDKAAPRHVKLHKLSYPFVADPYRHTDVLRIREGMGAQPDDCVFGFSFDFESSVERKNPTGVIEAFHEAFKPEDPVLLLIKAATVWDKDKSEMEVLMRVAARDHMRDRIRFVGQTLPRQQNVNLMDACDCYVSLHRSEGLGLGILEAISRGKPVIATGYGGNMEYMSCTNSYVVRHTPTEVKRDFRHYYPAGARWAEPDLDHAVELMRQVAFDRDTATMRGHEARRQLTAATDPRHFRRQLHELLLAVG